jgi:hypothetical protein
VHFVYGRIGKKFAKRAEKVVFQHLTDPVQFVRVRHGWKRKLFQIPNDSNPHVCNGAHAGPLAGVRVRSTFPATNAWTAAGGGHGTCGSAKAGASVVTTAQRYAASVDHAGAAKHY